jgi:quinol monooxygenase YgiN
MKIRNLILCMGAAALLAGCSANKQAAVNQSVENPKMMIIAKVAVKPDKTRDFIAAAKEIIEKSNKEAGCSFYQLYQDPYDNAKFVFVEEYKNQAAVDAHFATEHFKGFGAKIGDLVAGPADIKIITVAAEAKK